MNPINSWTPRRIGLLGLAALLLVLAMLMPRLRRPAELRVYLTAAQRMMAGEQVYRPDDAKPFTYPPFFALPFVPLAMVPADIQREVWWLCNLLLVMAVIGLVTRLSWPVLSSGGGPRGARFLVSVALIAVLSTKFLLMPLAHESHDLIVLTLVLLTGMALAGGNEPRAGLWAGVATACKATPLLLLPFLVWQRRFVAAGVFVLALVSATLLPDLLFPSRDGTLWVQAWHSRFIAKVGIAEAPAVASAWQEWNSLNQSLPGTLHRLFMPSTRPDDPTSAVIFPLTKLALRLLTVGLELAVAAWFAWLTFPGRSKRAAADDRSFEVLGQLGASLCAMLLLSPMSSTYHFCALVVPISFCVTFWIYCGRDRIVGSVLGIQLLISLLSAQDLVGHRLADALLEYGILTADAVLLLAACGYILVWQLPAITHQRAMTSEKAAKTPLLQRAA